MYSFFSFVGVCANCRVFDCPPEVDMGLGWVVKVFLGDSSPYLREFQRAWGKYHVKKINHSNVAFIL